ncbi:MAG TPA: GGDEF domain-containing protein [Caproicibacter sp.]|nr:GGDEF domain-containing protein [Caproicibacter sp.]
MKNLTYLVKDIPALRAFLKSQALDASEASKSVLVQVFSSLSERAILGRITDAITEYIPKAVIVGSTTVGEILHGQLQVGTVVLSFSFFDETVLKPFVIKNPIGTEFEAGKSLIKKIKSIEGIAGVLMLATPQSISVSKLFSGMSDDNFDFPVFGGGAGVYDPNMVSMIFLGRQIFSKGAIAVAFLSKSLHIYTKTFLGWRPLSKEMTITEASGKLLKKIDGERAFDVYSRYLNIPNDKQFFTNALEFPILTQKDGEMIARVPLFVTEDGCIGFLADIEPGEKFHIGYGEPDLILNHSESIRREMYDFEPDSIFLYACICRRFLLQADENLEIQMLDEIAPTTGFYTYGEFIRRNNRMLLLNSTIVVVGLREGERKQRPRPAFSDTTGNPPTSNDPFSATHSRIITRLLHFISVVTSELEDANKELKRVSGIDKLTQINNRLKLDEILQYELSRSARYGTDLSVLILDIDHFKEVNDNFGHLAGDLVLTELAGILKFCVRESDTVGRWGGEEFLVILPQTSLESALTVAEKIRASVEKMEIPDVEHITCSIGAASFHEGDDSNNLLSHADMALYHAKSGGRNRVES